MGTRDRVGHNTKRKPEHTLAEKRQARREDKQARKAGKRKRRAAVARPSSAR